MKYRVHFDLFNCLTYKMGMRKLPHRVEVNSKLEKIMAVRAICSAWLV